jgi:hypothetical protein
MARRKKKEMAEYECVVFGGCVVHVENPNGQGTYEKLFKLNDGDIDYDECMLKVPAGTIVCKHFEPYNEQAEDDRDAQMEAPEKFIEEESDKILIAEIMVKKSFFKTVDAAMESLTELLDGKELIQGDDKVRTTTINELASCGKDAKETRSILSKKLKDGGVTGFFRGAQPEALAALVYDNGLHEE